MTTKAERITELLGIINNKSERIKKFKFECGRQSIQICVLNLRIKEFETALEEVGSDFYYIHRHSEDAHSDSYKFMNKIGQVLKNAETPQNPNSK